jgi:hypothetical protein
MEPRGCNRWQPAANRPKAETAKTSENPLPSAATGCVRRSMVRRGSTVRVRQRAPAKAPHTRGFHFLVMAAAKPGKIDLPWSEAGRVA